MREVAKRKKKLRMGQTPKQSNILPASSGLKSTIPGLDGRRRHSQPRTKRFRMVIILAHPQLLRPVCQVSSHIGLTRGKYNKLLTSKRSAGRMSVRKVRDKHCCGIVPRGGALAPTHGRFTCLPSRRWRLVWNCDHAEAWR